MSGALHPDFETVHFNMAAYCIGRAARTRPNHPALMVIGDPKSGDPSEVWTFRHLEAAVLNTAAALQDLGLSPGARIVIALENTSTYAVLFFGAIAGGFVPLPVSRQLRTHELEFIISDSKAELVALADAAATPQLAGGVQLCDGRQAALWAKGSARATYASTTANDPAFLIYTSGTTAQPKGVLHAHRSVLGRRPMYESWYGLSAADRMLHAGAFNWTYTLGTGLCDPWANGATAIVYTGEKDPGLWPSLIAKTGATLFAAVPSLYRQILKYGSVSPTTLGVLRHGLMAGETPPPGLFEAWEAATAKPLYEALGMSEISTYISSGPDTPRKAGKVGRPQPGRNIAILPVEGNSEPLARGEEGLIAVRRDDPGLMLRYWNRPDEERAVMRGDWFAGGDVGLIDHDGYVTHLGRANDIMKAFGYRVSPQEVETAIAQCSGVAEVACAEIQVRAGVSVIGAFVVRAAGSTLDEKTLLHFASERLAAYKTPRQIIFLDSLPRTANGKLKRADLRAI